jgi:hypothetical protein
MEPMAQDFAPSNDRRKRPRFHMNAPLTIYAKDHKISAYTRDLSNRGVYFYLDLSNSKLIDRDFEFVIELPPEITLSICCRIRCRDRLVRKEKTSMNLTGVAAEILDYSVPIRLTPTPTRYRVVPILRGRRNRASAFPFNDYRRIPTGRSSFSALVAGVPAAVSGRHGLRCVFGESAMAQRFCLPLLSSHRGAFSLCQPSLRSALPQVP